MCVNGKYLLDDDENPKIEIFKQDILSIIDNYQSKIRDWENELEALEEKRLSSGFTSKEEDIYVDINNFLDRKYSAKHYISRRF